MQMLIDTFIEVMLTQVVRLCLLVVVYLVVVTGLVAMIPFIVDWLF
jgi:hypothetical protein